MLVPAVASGKADIALTCWSGITGQCCWCAGGKCGGEVWRGDITCWWTPVSMAQYHYMLVDSGTCGVVPFG